MIGPTQLHRPLHLSALLLAAVTFPLIFMGGLVTSHGAGMAVPDWPNSYGYNMFTFPPSQWVGGIWYEHVHRLWGSAVGFIAIVLVMQAWGPGRTPRVRRWLGICACIVAGLSLACIVPLAARIASSSGDEPVAVNLQHLVVGFASLALILAAAWTARRREPRRWVRWLCVAVLVAVCIQGLLGGLRVTKVNLTLAIIHGCFGQLFFCLAGITALVTSRGWISARDLSGSADSKSGRRLAALGAICLLAILLQLILGASMRHHGAGLAIPDLPLAYGKVLPPADSASLAKVNEFRAWVLHEKPVTLWQVWLHFAHRLGAVAVTGLLSVLAIQTWRHKEARMRWTAGIVAALLIAQFTLGVLTVYLKKPADIASLHVAVGALLLLSVAVLTTRTLRLYSTRFRGRATAAHDLARPRVEMIGVAH